MKTRPQDLPDIVNGRPTMRSLIIGGGIAGPVAALALHPAGSRPRSTRHPHDQQISARMSRCHQWSGRVVHARCPRAGAVRRLPRPPTSSCRVPAASGWPESRSNDPCPTAGRHHHQADGLASGTARTGDQPRHRIRVWQASHHCSPSDSASVPRDHLIRAHRLGLRRPRRPRGPG
jgi:hypothetical protein